MAHEILLDLVVIFGVAVPILVLFSRFRLPTITGLLVAGVVVGPHLLALARDRDSIAVLAEIGVILLLFTLGLEFSLPKLQRLWRMVAIGGALQVCLTAGAAAGVAVALGVAGPEAVLAGFLVSLSSTAIVLRALSERGEVETLHGRVVVGILIFQDICLVPMLLAVPLLAGEEVRAWTVIELVLKTLAVVLGVLVGLRRLASRVLGWVAAARNREAFVMATIVACLGIAWLTSLAGLSLALGAFLAGLVVSETEYGHQAMADVLPFRDTLIGVFFVSVGMLLDVPFLLDHAGAVAALAGAVVAGKALLAGLAALLLRMPLRVAVVAGLGLAQMGEFSFVLAAAARVEGLGTGEFSSLILNAGVLTMLVTPLLVRAAPHVATSLGPLHRLERLLGYDRPPEEGPAAEEIRSGHVLVAGYGLGGRMAAAALREARIPCVILELNPENVRRGRDRGDPVYQGDVTTGAALTSAGLAGARALLLLVSDSQASLAAARAARSLAPEVPILGRTRWLSDREALRAAGADSVVSEELEGSVEVLARALRHLGVEEADAGRLLEEAREADPERPA